MRRLGLLDLLDGAALHEQALYRIERRQFVVPGLQFADFGGDAEQLADEVFDMRGEIDQQIGFRLAVERVGVGASRHQAVVQRRVAGSEMRDKGAVEPDQALAFVQIGKREPVFQGEFGHERLVRE